MSEKYKFHDPEGRYFVTLTVVAWIDLFTRKELKEVILTSLAYCQAHKGLVIHAWVLMGSHLHLIISSTGEDLSSILRDLKKHTSKELVKTIREINESRADWLLKAFAEAAAGIKRVQAYKVWQDGNHPVLLDTNKMLTGRLEYVHQNPVAATIVEEPEHYLFSSARDYAGQPGLLKVSLL